MTSRRNLGPVLAAIGAVAIVGAVVAGVVVVGGPGEARAYRLDQMKLEAVQGAADLARCAYRISGQAPESLEDAERTAQEGRLRIPPVDYCYFRDLRAPLSGIQYRVTASTEIEICADFLRPSPKERPAYAFIATPDFLETRTSAGQHCFHFPLAATPPSSPS